jgi:hypothetical protein
MQVFTSAAVNYVPKARVLAHSVKQHHPEAKFHLVLCDPLPDWLAESPEPFDTILPVEQLPIPDVRRWVFFHNLVELCTAVKGAAARVILEQYPGEPVLYFDPDIVLFSRVDRILEALGQHDVVLTPHQTEPEATVDAVLDNEMGSLKHGVFNLGFLGLSGNEASVRFNDWWYERLLHFCQIDFKLGLFTDQRWMDLAPVLFDNVGILRDPGYNVATWNLTNRTVTGTGKSGFRVNGQPLYFYHFSGFDSGAQKTMLDKYGSKSPALYELRRWYINRCEELGQEDIGSLPWNYGYFDNGAEIIDDQRRIYRKRIDLQKAFPEPAAAPPGQRSFYRWYQQEVFGRPRWRYWPRRVFGWARSLRQRAAAL